MSDNSNLDESKLTPEGAPSPFLPSTNIMFAWDSTSLNLFKTCPRLYQYTILEGYSTRAESVHLRFGAEYHSALEDFDHAIAEGLSTDEALQHTIRHLHARTVEWDVAGNDKALRYKSRENLFQLVIDYIDHFTPDPAKTYIKSDGTPAVELSFSFALDYGPDTQPKPEYKSTGKPFEPLLDAGSVNYIWSDGTGVEVKRNYQPYLLSGHLDRVARFNDQLFILDRKTTTTTLSQHYFAQYSPHNQMSLYTLAGSIILDTPIAGVIIDAAQIKLEEPNAFARGFTYRTEAQLVEWQEDLRTTLALAETYALNNHWPQNDTSCDKFGGCRFREICAKDPHVRKAFLRTDFHQLELAARWNPLKSR